MARSSQRLAVPEGGRCTAFMAWCSFVPGMPPCGPCGDLRVSMYSLVARSLIDLSDIGHLAAALMGHKGP
jgi:hypothetical protein